MYNEFAGGGVEGTHPQIHDRRGLPPSTLPYHGQRAGTLGWAIRGARIHLAVGHGRMEPVSSPARQHQTRVGSQREE